MASRYPFREEGRVQNMQSDAFEGAKEPVQSKTCTYEDYLEEHGSLTYRFSGVSMLPLLRQGKDFYTVRKKENKRCDKYDVVLYRRPPDQYVLHRIVKVRETDYVILGDNCMSKEYGITDDDILAVMTSFTRSGKEHSVQEMPYRIYSRVWYAIYPVRLLYKRIVLKIKSLRKVGS